MDKQGFAAALKREREARAMTPELVAQRVYVSTQKYLDWENAKELPDLDTAQKLADVFAIPLDSLTNAVYVYEPKLKMGAGDEISEEERKRIIAERENADIDRYNRGQSLMKIIIIVEAVMLAISFFTSSILSSIFKIIMLVCLWKGQSWARYVYVILTAIGTLIIFAAMGALFETSVVLGVLGIIEIAYGIAVCILLTANKSIDEFLYEQKTSH